LSLLISCAGLRSKTDAQEEFDLGLSFFNRGKYEEAILHFEKATEFNPEFGQPYLYIGRSYVNLGKWREAISPLRTAYRLAPEETKKEIADILTDLLLKNATKLDKDTQSQVEELLRQK
jgi:tetratricopeptide (TPR) repeat protein